MEWSDFRTELASSLAARESGLPVAGQSGRQADDWQPG